MSLFGKAPSTAPTFGRSDNSSIGSLDGVPIQADRGGAVVQTAAPSVASPRGSPATSGPQAASPSPPEARKVFENWAQTNAVAQAAALVASLGAMAAGTKNDPSIAVGSAALKVGETGVNVQTDNDMDNGNADMDEHSGVSAKESSMTMKSKPKAKETHETC